MGIESQYTSEIHTPHFFRLQNEFVSFISLSSTEPRGSFGVGFHKGDGTLQEENQPSFNVENQAYTWRKYHNKRDIYPNKSMTSSSLPAKISFQIVIYRRHSTATLGFTSHPS